MHTHTDALCMSNTKKLLKPAIMCGALILALWRIPAMFEQLEESGALSGIDQSSSMEEIEGMLADPLTGAIQDSESASTEGTQFFIPNRETLSPREKIRLLEEAEMAREQTMRDGSVIRVTQTDATGG